MPPHMYTDTTFSHQTNSSDTTSTTTSKHLIKMDHATHSEEQLHGAIEIIPNRLYYAPLKYLPTDEYDSDAGHTPTATDTANNTNQQTTTKPIHYFTIDNELIYWNFFLDFGPLNLGQLYRFSSILNSKLSSPLYKNSIICYYSGCKGTQRANASFLIGAWSMIYLGRGLREAYYGFQDFSLVDNGSGSTNNNSGGESDDENQVWNMPLSQNCSLPPPPRKSRRAGSSSPFGNLNPLPPFHDASPIVCTYDLTVLDCLRGLDRARELGFFKFGNAPSYPVSSRRQQQQVVEEEQQRIKKQRRSDAQGTTTSSNTTTDPSQQEQQYGLGTGNPTTFNVDEYEYFEQVENGDLNWIIQNKILAVAGPQNQKVITPEGFCMLTPQDYIPYFRKTNVKLVVRLNKKCYDENQFIQAGIRHVEHYYLDGSCPEMRILHSVVSDMESVAPNEAIAVHCKAGLGRTGTCIGAYMMKHYRMTAKEVIGWMRICRPGMVIGPQQHFLADIQKIMWQEGDTFRGVGLKAMIVDTTLEEGDKKVAATATAASGNGNDLSIITTPQTAPAIHASIVSPDGQPLDIPTTPVSRKLDGQMKEEDVIMESSTEPLSQIHSTSSSTASLLAMDSLKVNSSETLTNNETELEGAQANALLSRRIEEYKARHQSN